MFNLEGTFAELIRPIENASFKNASSKQANLLLFFRLSQDALWVLLNNGGVPLKMPDHTGGPQLLTYHISGRVLTMAQASVRMAMAGYCPEALALSRTIAELGRITSYFAFKPEKIGDYLSGKLKVIDILKKEQELHQSKENPQFEMWKFLSSYSHGTADLLETFVKTEGQFHSQGVLITDDASQESVLFGTISLFFMQYVWFRLLLRKILTIPQEVNKADKQLFLSDLARKFTKAEFLNKLPELYEAIYS